MTIQSYKAAKIPVFISAIISIWLSKYFPDITFWGLGKPYSSFLMIGGLTVILVYGFIALRRFIANWIVFGRNPKK